MKLVRRLRPSARAAVVVLALVVAFIAWRPAFSPEQACLSALAGSPPAAAGSRWGVRSVEPAGPGKALVRLSNGVNWATCAAAREPGWLPFWTESGAFSTLRAPLN